MLLKDYALLTLNEKEFQQLEVILNDLHNETAYNFYSQYTKMVSNCIFVTSYQEYEEFTNDGFKIDDELIILTYLNMLQYILGIGGYEEDIAAKLIAFVNLRTCQNLETTVIVESYNKLVNLNDNVIFVDIDGDDNFFDFVNYLNHAYLKDQFTVIIFAEDIYCASNYHLAIGNKTIVDIINKEWTDTKISLVSI